MNHRLIEALMSGLAPVIRDHVAANVAKASESLLARISELESRPVAQNGKDADPDVIANLVADAVGKIVLPDPKAIEQDVLKQAVAGEVARAVGELPRPQNGKDADPLVIEAMVAELVGKLPPAAPGKDADPADMLALLIEQSKPVLFDHIKQTVDALPKPKDGESVAIEDVRDALREMVTEAVDSLPKAKDGVGLAGALIDRDGNLVVTLTDGTQKQLGRIVGADADMDALALHIEQQVKALPKPRDGTDGLGFEDLIVDHDGDRGFALKFMRGDQKKEFAFTLPFVIDRGVWREGSFKRGDGVTWGGSFFIAQRDTEAKPETPDCGWRLAVKRGRDAKGG